MRHLRPGFHRRIRLHPLAGRIVAGLEDNLHRFEVRLAHAAGIVTEAELRAERYPWTTCAEAPAFLRQQVIGKRLEELKELDCLSHCTHLFELAILCAAHASDVVPVQFDLHVDDWQDSGTRVQLFTDGALVLALDVMGRRVVTPGEWFGRDLFQSEAWRRGLHAAAREQAMLISRAIYVSLGRAAPIVERATERGSSTRGVCFTYQPSRVGNAVQVPHSRREFGEEVEDLLNDFTP